MSLQTDIEADATAVFLDTDGFAISITHLPGGSGGTAIDAIVGDEKLSREFGEGGDQILILRDLIVDDSLTLTYDDRFTIDSINYGVRLLPKGLHGLRNITIGRVRKRKTSNPTGNSIDI